jgi:hypothetical protein
VGKKSAFDGEAKIEQLTVQRISQPATMDREPDQNASTPSQ